MVTSASDDVLVATTSVASHERRRILESLGVKVVAFDGPSGRIDLAKLVQ